MLRLFYNFQRENIKVVVFLFFSLFSVTLHATSCLSKHYFSHPEANFWQLDHIELDIEIDFLNKDKTGQKVFLIEKNKQTVFSLENQNQTVYSKPGLRYFVYCINKRYVNEQPLEIRSDSSVRCTVNKKLHCEANN